jgi:hypothetical protein
MEFEKWERLNRILLIKHFKIYDKEVTPTDDTYLAWARLRWQDAQLPI